MYETDIMAETMSVKQSDSKCLPEILLIENELLQIDSSMAGFYISRQWRCYWSKGYLQVSIVKMWKGKEIKK